ncbi:hypothetical protein [Nitrospira defluvii]|uniref:hypothetical protein n=1 Tax=Nitrospira defluvii TaxID=330214 RepID=UPI001BB48144|nr:hypothetical protein [Nitrospira defluvii]
MTEPSTSPSNASPSTPALPERLCTWCKVAMTTRLVAGGQFIHYTCPKCVFQHTTKRAPQ